MFYELQSNLWNKMDSTKKRSTFWKNGKKRMNLVGKQDVMFRITEGTDRRENELHKKTVVFKITPEIFCIQGFLQQAYSALAVSESMGERWGGNRPVGADKLYTTIIYLSCRWSLEMWNVQFQNNKTNFFPPPLCLNNNTLSVFFCCFVSPPMRFFFKA